jgi:hypothetical protein
MRGAYLPARLVAIGISQTVSPSRREGTRRPREQTLAIHNTGDGTLYY